MLRIKSCFAVGALTAVLAGCGGGAGNEGVKAPVNASGKKTRAGHMVDKEAANDFTAALNDFASADSKGEWSQDDCKRIAGEFMSASKKQETATNKPLAEAQYDAGLAYQRCGMDSEAQRSFEATLRTDAKFYRARVQLALFEYQKTNNVDSAIAALEQIIRDAQYQNVEALVAVAALQMERNGDQSDSDGKDDLERAKKNLQRALAIDDAYMPAFNQLAIYYLELAKSKSEGATNRRRGRRRGLVVSGTRGADINEQMLDLAALVASQAIRKNPKYAPIHNTSGLIQVELKNFNGAVKSFAMARSLDKGFFEAQMNYAAVNLSFRGFEEAEKAYEAALRLRPKEYEAHLGLALAIRGQITMGNRDKLLPRAEKELAAAKKLEPDRPETYYNEAILTQEFKAKGASDEQKSIAMMESAIKQYEDFVRKAGSDSSFAAAVKRSNERIQDMRDTIKFLKEGAEAREKAAAAAAAAPPKPTDSAGAAASSSAGASGNGNNAEAAPPAATGGAAKDQAGAKQK